MRVIATAAMASLMAIPVSTGARAQSAGAPYQNSVLCHMLDGSRACSTSFAVKRGQVLTLQTASTSRSGAKSGQVQCSLALFFGNRQVDLPLPTVPATEAAIDGASIAVTGFASGKFNGVSCYRTDSAGDEADAVTLIGYLTSAPAGPESPPD